MFYEFLLGWPKSSFEFFQSTEKCNDFLANMIIHYTIVYLPIYVIYEFSKRFINATNFFIEGRNEIISFLILLIENSIYEVANLRAW